jgi:hypothetical protein
MIYSISISITASDYCVTALLRYSVISLPHPGYGIAGWAYWTSCWNAVGNHVPAGGESGKEFVA